MCVDTYFWSLHALCVCVCVCVCVYVCVCMCVGSFPAVNSCSVKNGGCEHRCVDLGNEKYKCECRSNYQLKRDGKHCECEFTFICRL